MEPPVGPLGGVGHAVAIHSGCRSWNPARPVLVARPRSFGGVSDSCRHFCCLDDTPTVAFAWSRNQRIHVAGHTSIQLSRNADVIHCLDAISVTGSLRCLYAPGVVLGTPALLQVTATPPVGWRIGVAMISAMLTSAPLLSGRGVIRPRVSARALRG